MDGQKPEQTPTPMQFAPGDTIRPQQTAEPQPATSPTPVNDTPAPPSQASIEPPQVSQPAPLPAVPAMPAQPPLVAASDVASSQAAPNYGAPEGEVITWTASEFIAHHKTSGWYTLLILASVAAAALIWFLTKDIVSALVVVFASGILATYATRKPRQLSYQIDHSGLTIGAKHYGFNEFRSFSIVPEGAFSSIVFTPLKRFGTLVTIYYDPQDEEQILDALSLRLPHEERRPDPIDGMMRRIRF